MVMPIHTLEFTMPAILMTSYKIFTEVVFGGFWICYIVLFSEHFGTKNIYFVIFPGLVIIFS